MLVEFSLVDGAVEVPQHALRLRGRGMRFEVGRGEGGAIVDDDHVVVVAGGEEVLLVLWREGKGRFQSS